MMQKELRWTPFAMLLWREIRRFIKVVVQTVFTPLITSSLYLLIFGVSLGAKIDMGTGAPYLLFLVPGLVMMGVLNNAFQNSSSSIVGAKFGGDLEDYRASPLSNDQIIWAFAFGGLARGLIVGAITFGVGTAFSWFNYGELLLVKNPAAFFFFVAVGGLSFAKLGLSVAFWAKSFDQLSAVGTFILTPLLYLGGVFYSIEILHPFWQKLSQFNPLLYLINGVRYGIMGQTDVDLGLAVGVSLLTLVVFHCIAKLSLSKGTFTRW